MTREHYTESLPYELELTSRVLHEAIVRFFSEKKFEITHDEFVVLDTLSTNEGISQIDLAKLILKGRAHTGRFLMSLEKKGLVKRTPSKKGKRLIMKNVVTAEGKKVLENTGEAIELHIEEMNLKDNLDKAKKLIELLHSVRKDISERFDIKFQ